jgi:hypothetical protein
MTNKELENQLNEMNLTSHSTPSGTTIVDVEPEPSQRKETEINENLNNVPNEISPPPEDSIVKSIEREGSRQLGGGRRRRGLYNSLRQYNSRTE